MRTPFLPLSLLTLAALLFPEAGFSLGCEEAFGPAGAETSAQKEYFAELLGRGKNAPIEDFLKLWAPNKKGDDLEAPFFACEDAPWGLFKTGRDGSVPPECAPDALYSWGPAAKVTSLQGTMADGQAWRGKPNPFSRGMGEIFTSISPSSTFGYGMIPVRLKIKKGVPFRDQGGFGFAGEGEVGFRSNHKYHDFVISDASVIESWSFGTPELYDEIVRDILRIRSGRRAAVYLEGEPRKTGMDRLYGQEIDGNLQREEQLRMRLMELIRMILAGEGRIHYSAGTCRSRALEYSTDRPSYINPNPHP